MEQVTEGVSVMEVNNVTVTEEDLNYYTHGIFSHIKLDSSYAILSDFLLLKIYYNKLYQIKTFDNNEHQDIIIWFHGSEETNLNNINKLIKNLEKAYGSFTSDNQQVILKTKRNSMNSYYIELIWKDIPRSIYIKSSNFKNPQENMMYCETANNMVYWAHDSGLVVSPYAKIAIESNQIIPGPKYKKPIKYDVLMALLSIGFSFSSYAQTHLLVYDKIPFNYSYVKNRDFSKEAHSTTLLNDSTITNKDINWSDVSSFGDNPYYIGSNINDTTKLGYSKMVGLATEIGIVNSGSLGTSYKIIMFEAVIKQFITYGSSCYVVVTIPDNEMGNQLVKIVNFLINYEKGTTKITNSKVNSCILNSNFLSPEEKIMCNVFEPKPNLNLLDYSSENNLVLLIEISQGVKIINAINKQTIVEGFYNNESNHFSDYYVGSSFDHLCASSWHFTNKLDVKVNFWSEFIFKDIFNVNNIICMTRFMVLQNQN